MPPCVGGARVGRGDGLDLPVGVWGSAGGGEAGAETSAGQQGGQRLRLAQLGVATGPGASVQHRGNHAAPPHGPLLCLCVTVRSPPPSPQVVCALQGALPQLQSQAQVLVDGRSLLASGLNVSAAEGRASLLLSVSPPSSNQTQPALATSFAVQLKGQIIGRDYALNPLFAFVPASNVAFTDP